MQAHIVLTHLVVTLHLGTSERTPTEALGIREVGEAKGYDNSEACYVLHHVNRWNVASRREVFLSGRRISVCTQSDDGRMCALG